MKNFREEKYAFIYLLNTKIRLTMLCLSVFELYSRWVPLLNGLGQWPLTRKVGMYVCSRYAKS